jgi:hypothetical protein
MLGQAQHRRRLAGAEKATHHYVLSGHLLSGGLRPAGPPFTLSRAPLRRRAPFAWLASVRSLATLGPITVLVNPSADAALVHR